MIAFLKPIQFLLFLVSVSSSIVSVAQKQKILVVPYTRFQFVSEYQLSEIAQINGVETQGVYNEFVNSLTEALTKFSTDKYEFVFIKEIDYLSIKKQLQYGLQKFKGRKYNASNLSVLANEKYAEILKQNNANFMLFINWYAIQKNVHVSYTGDNNKRNPFSLHKIDYDVYNVNKEKIIGKGNVKLNCGDFPSAEMIQEKCLKSSSLVVCYQDLMSELLNELSSQQ